MPSATANSPRRVQRDAGAGERPSLNHCEPSIDGPLRSPLRKLVAGDRVPGMLASRTMKAPDIMTEEVRTVRADQPVSVALEMLSATESRHLPVVNRRGELEGILSDRDLRGLLGRYDADSEQFAAAWNKAHMPVSDVMTRDPITVDDAADVEEIVELFVDQKLGAVPVVDSDKHVLGIISYIDVLRAWQREHEATGVPGILPTTAELEDRARANEARRTR